jgi:hypothetical protein
MFFDLLELIEVSKFTTLSPPCIYKEMHKDGRKHKVLTQFANMRKKQVRKYGIEITFESLRTC